MGYDIHAHSLVLAEKTNITNVKKAIAGLLETSHQMVELSKAEASMTSAISFGKSITADLQSLDRGDFS
jgi:hypothetical protein